MGKTRKNYAARADGNPANLMLEKVYYNPTLTFGCSTWGLVLATPTGTEREMAGRPIDTGSAIAREGATELRAMQPATSVSPPRNSGALRYA